MAEDDNIVNTEQSAPKSWTGPQYVLDVRGCGLSCLGYVKFHPKHGDRCRRKAVVDFRGKTYCARHAHNVADNIEEDIRLDQKALGKLRDVLSS